MVRYYITDRRSAGGQERLLVYVQRAIDAGVDLIQVRERDLSGRELTSLTAQILRLSAGSRTRILVNDRTDIAMAAAAHGVHLRDDSVSPQDLRCVVPAGFVVAVSAHSRNGILRAQTEGADFVVFGPVFAPRSKEYGLPPKGLE